MPDARFFVDTNVILYSLDSSHAEKQRRAKLWIDALWETGAGRLSWQVLHEFYSNAIRKSGVSPRLARKTVEVFARWKPAEMSMGLIQRGWYWTDEAQLNYWDSLIVAAAERLGCAWLLSEDFQPGRKYGMVTVLNPFFPTPPELAITGLPER